MASVTDFSGYGQSKADPVLIGGQSPTLTNPPRRSQPVWDLPSVPGLADDNGFGWRCYVPPDHYPMVFYQQVQNSGNLVNVSSFVADAKAGSLPALVYVWHASPNDEHPPSNITNGVNQIWQCVDAVVKGGGWAETVRIFDIALQVGF